MPEDYILRIDKVVKRFGNVTALAVKMGLANQP